MPLLRFEAPARDAALVVAAVDQRAHRARPVRRRWPCAREGRRALLLSPGWGQQRIEAGPAGGMAVVRDAGRSTGLGCPGAICGAPSSSVLLLVGSGRGAPQMLHSTAPGVSFVNVHTAQDQLEAAPDEDEAASAAAGAGAGAGPAAFAAAVLVARSRVGAARALPLVAPLPAATAPAATA
eukprot:CAMPEP_0182538686 /NCGR_PEP_ID=MMETSP1323-20130603/24089_1 /TAXON_ID=236787 /ORGANISM="Florenciella parvula, Strain RCC1693" /LENGTH=180 /DNA_ID=CAMNT_0024749175 /DNA_START=38 /DNA_END=578 /DNA_ORIENTATION=+